MAHFSGSESGSTKFQYDCRTQSVNRVIYTKYFNELFISLQLFLYQYLFIDYWSCHLLLHNLCIISNSGRKRNNLLLIEYKLYWTKHLNWSLDRLSIAWKSGQSNYYIAEVTGPTHHRAPRMHHTVWIIIKSYRAILSNAISCILKWYDLEHILSLFTLDNLKWYHFIFYPITCHLCHLVIFQNDLILMCNLQLVPENRHDWSSGWTGRLKLD